MALWYTAGQLTGTVTHLFALSALSLADAGIAAWDSKFDSSINLCRPVSAIRATGGANANRKPLSSDRSRAPWTPCFPAWTSELLCLVERALPPPVNLDAPAIQGQDLRGTVPSLLNRLVPGAARA